MTKPNGGPAFPHPVTHATADMACPRCSARVTAFGMSLRDYFAGQYIASAGPISRNAELYSRVVADVAIVAYAIADAMLAERSKE